MAARKVVLSNGKMIIQRWVAIDGDGNTRLTTGYPALAPGEIAMELRITVPVTLFQKPMLKAEITVPLDHNPTIKLQAETVGNITEAIRQATGLEIVVRQEEAGR